MKRRLIAGAATLAVVAAAAAPASAAPGSTFPEQPGSIVAQGCASVVLNTGNAGEHNSGRASGILIGLIMDACYGG